LPKVSSSMMYAKCGINSLCQMKLSSSHLIWFHHDQSLQHKNGRLTACV